jgi:uncharacterized protein (TIRG00374 family)
VTVPRHSDWPSIGRLTPLLLATVVTTLCLALLARDFATASLQSALTSARPEMLLLALLLSALTIALKALRWRALYPAGARPGLSTALLGTAAAIAANWLIPARLGEDLKVGLATAELRGRVAASRGAGQSLGVLVVEKMLDGLALVLAIGVLLLLGGPPGWLNRLGAALGLGTIFAFALVLLALARPGGRCWIDYQSRRLAPSLHARVRPIAASFAEGLLALREDRALPGVLLATLAAWVIGLGVNWAAGMSIGLDLGIAPSLGVLIALYGGAVLPSLPTRLGVFQYTCVLALAPFGVGSGQALAYSLALYVAVYLLPILMGLLATPRLGAFAGSAGRRQGEIARPAGPPADLRVGVATTSGPDGGRR